MQGISQLAYRYAKALRAVAKERQELEQIYSDVEQVKAILADLPELQAFLRDPTVRSSEKRKVFDTVFQPRVSSLFYHFLLLLNRKRREPWLEEMLHAFDRLEQMSRGEETVVIKTAVALPADLQQRLVQRLELMVKKKLLPQFTVDPQLLGGFIARFPDRLLDASVVHQLQRLRQQLEKPMAKRTDQS